MNTKITFLDKLYNLTGRKGERVKGYCYYCGRAIFNWDFATSIDEHGECVYCRDGELRGAEKARQIIMRGYNESLGERGLRRTMQKDRGQMRFFALYYNKTISGAVHQANKYIKQTD